MYNHRDKEQIVGNKNWIDALPAYGRKYSHKDQIVTDWEAGLDFVVDLAGQRKVYVNKQDAERLNLVVVVGVGTYPYASRVILGLGKEE